MRKKIKLYDLILKTAKKGLHLQRRDGSFPKGHNGPWEDEDTYVRTTAHWALIMFKAHELTSNINTKFLESAMRACEYLLKDKNRPYGYTFYCRKDTTGKDMCNGLIGQVWAIEPLIFVGRSKDKNKYLKSAKEVIQQHDYSFDYHAWHYVEIDGNKQGIHTTLNQQIWFSSMALILGKTLDDEPLSIKGRDFFENVDSFITYYNEKGLIKHTFSTKNIITNLEVLKREISELIGKDELNLKRKKQTKLRSLGYLPFILYGFALLYDYTSEEEFWKNPELKKILKDSIDFVISNYPYDYLRKVGYNWRYNPTGIEMAYVLQELNDLLELNCTQNEIDKWLNLQINGYYDFRSNLMIKNTSDPNILSSRFYEAIRLKNNDIEI